MWNQHLAYDEFLDDTRRLFDERKMKQFSWKDPFQWLLRKCFPLILSSCSIIFISIPGTVVGILCHDQSKISHISSV